MAQQGSGAAADTKDKLGGLADAAGDKAREAASSAQEMAENAAGQVREYGAQAQDMASDVKTYIEKSLKEKPIQTLAGAAVAGFLLGAIWKR